MANGPIVAFAGRRTDRAASFEVRFPFENVPAVSHTLAALLSRERPSAVLASGACGCDLLVLQAADLLDIKTRIVLPFAPEIFRRTSVVDRPYPEFWGKLFDALIAKARTRGDIVVLPDYGDRKTAYGNANRALINEANLLARATIARCRLAVIAWDGVVREPTDTTYEFAKLAIQSGFSIQSISTLTPSGPAPALPGHYG